MEKAEDRIDGQFCGIPISIRGMNMVVFLALVAVTSYTIYYLSVIVSNEHMAISGSIEAQTHVLEKQTEAIREQNYILLADEKESEKIRRAYRMPPSLKEKLVERDGR